MPVYVLAKAIKFKYKVTDNFLGSFDLHKEYYPSTKKTSFYHENKIHGNKKSLDQLSVKAYYSFHRT